jgi:hypothetical protein
MDREEARATGVTAMTTLHHKPADLASAQRWLQGRLNQFGRRVRSHLLVEAAAQWLAMIVAMLLVTFALDRWLRLSSLTRRGLLLVLIVVVLIETWRRLLAPFRMKLDADVLASALERKTRVPVAARVATVLQLPSQNSNTSRAMIERAVERSHESLASIDFSSYLNARRRKYSVGAVAAIVVITLALVASAPSAARLWAARLFAGSNQPWPQKTYLAVTGLNGNTMTVPRGEPFALRVSARAGAVIPESVSIRWRQRGSSRATALLTKFGPNDFRYDFPPVESDVEAEVSGGDDVFGPFAIRPVDRPRIVDLELITQHPTEPQPRTHGFSGEDAGDLSFLPLTQMELRFTANTAVAEARVRSSTTQPSDAHVQRIDDRRFALSWTHAAAMQLQIELTGVEAGLTSSPTNVSIGLTTDKPPRATLGFTGVRQRVTPSATIPLVAEARDDFGVSRVDLHLKSEIVDPADPKKVVSGASTQPVYGPATQPEKDVRQPRPLELPSLKMEPGHLLTLSAVATDACYVGAQSAVSRQITFRVVRPEELFREILLRQQSERAKFRRQIEEARKLRDALRGVPSADSITQSARQHRAMQREVARVQTALADSLTEMRLNVLGTSEAHELLQNNVLTPLKALDAELMAPQRDALDALRADDAPTLAAVQARQDQIIDRMSQILKQMSQWDSFVDVLNQLNEIIRVQNQVQQGTNQLKKSQTEGVFEK